MERNKLKKLKFYYLYESTIIYELMKNIIINKIFKVTEI